MAGITVRVLASLGAVTLLGGAAFFYVKGDASGLEGYVDREAIGRSVAGFRDAVQGASDRVREATAGRDGAGAGPSAGAVRGGSRGGPPAGASRRGGFSPAVTVVEAEARSVSRRLDAIGEARSLQGAQLAAEAAGRVVEVRFEPGKAVAKGEILLRLDDDAQRIAYERARANFDIAEVNRDRYRDLSSDEAASALEAESAATDFATARAELKRAEFDLEQRIVRAPFEGRAGLTDIEPGDYLRVGDPVTTLDDISAIVVSFLIPEEAATAVTLGQPVTVEPVSGGAALEGKITAIDSRVDPASRTLRVEATAPDEANSVTPGATVKVTTEQEGAPAVAVPGLAIQWDRSGAYVWRIAGDGAAERVNVTIAQRIDETVLVTGDVSEGDTIIAESADRVRPGMSFPQYARDRGGAGAAGAGAAR